MSDEEATVAPIKFEEIGDRPGDREGKRWVDAQIDLIRDVKVGLSARLGSCQLSVAELFALKEGGVVSLEQGVDSPVDLILEGRVIARGNIVAVDDQFGVQVTEILEDASALS